MLVAFDTTQITSAANFSNPKPGDPCHPLARGQHAPAIAFAIQERALSENLAAGPQGAGFQADIAYTLEARHHTQSVATSSVRRLTPRECERLQGFPDDYTLVPHRGKPMADGPRYKALGNSMAVPVMRWIGERIAAVDALTNTTLAA
ncbi:DNA cytosine methyltransferase [Sphingomonas sp. RRHST34]|uniref:DNA cytosine methyltransferase n=2 Tax=Sphingomonas citri TaxID=2862499 RepID=A0ABS7BQK9_9SPHN|nr:DNA cytosine methyltransferase [Sphingomonas citri]